MEDNPCPWCGQQVEKEPDTFSQYNMDWHEPCFWIFASQEATFNWASRYFRSISLSFPRYRSRNQHKANNDTHNED